MKNYINKKNTHEKTFTGTVQGNERGFAFIIPDDKQKYKNDFFVPKSGLGGVYDGDKVLAAIVRGGKDEARIIKVLEHTKSRVVGTLERGRLYPDDSRMPEIIIPRSLRLNAKNGDKVLCEITGYPKSGMPTGKVEEVLGEGGDFDAEELSIIRAFGLYGEFPAEVLSQADEVSSRKIKADRRRDLRDRLLITIDGVDTRDIDDAVSLEVIDGNYHLGVHIADVSHYVKYKSAIDKEAYGRGTSVYFPDRVLPMLPEQLSNGACSLNEGEDRYALSCLMVFDKNAQRLGYEICESIIRSAHRTTYAEINAMLDGDEKYPDLTETVRNMKALCLAMEKRREAAGEVNLDVREAKIYVDGDGEIVIPDYERGISERIIEQFMISANEAVAEFLQARKAPCLYRIHERPSEEKAAALSTFLKELGINVLFDAENIRPADFQKILKGVEDKPYSAVVNKVMLRSMQKARYDGENKGHFGLASDCYCHFTSPIRRYPDLFVHRVLKQILHGEDFLKYNKNLAQAGIDCSEKERIADEAERKVDDLYKVVYMYDRIGESYDAVISGVTNFGVFCELDNTIEGLIPLETLPDPSYEYFPEKFLLKGANTSFRLGDKIKIRVDNCDFGRLRVMFCLDN